MTKKTFNLYLGGAVVCLILCLLLVLFLSPTTEYEREKLHGLLYFVADGYYLCFMLPLFIALLSCIWTEKILGKQIGLQYIYPSAVLSAVGLVLACYIDYCILPWAIVFIGANALMVLIFLFENHQCIVYYCDRSISSSYKTSHILKLTNPFKEPCKELNFVKNKIDIHIKSTQSHLKERSIHMQSNHNLHELRQELVSGNYRLPKDEMLEIRDRLLEAYGLYINEFNDLVDIIAILNTQQLKTKDKW